MRETVNCLVLYWGADEFHQLAENPVIDYGEEFGEEDKYFDLSVALKWAQPSDKPFNLIECDFGNSKYNAFDMLGAPIYLGPSYEPLDNLVDAINAMLMEEDGVAAMIVPFYQIDTTNGDPFLAGVTVALYFNLFG